MNILEWLKQKKYERDFIKEHVYLLRQLLKHCRAKTGKPGNNCAGCVLSKQCLPYLSISIKLRAAMWDIPTGGNNE